MFITIETRKVIIENPYYSPNRCNIEPSHIEDTEDEVTIHETREQLRDFLAKRGSFTGNIRHFEAKEIFPKIKTTVNLDL